MSRFADSANHSTTPAPKSFSLRHIGFTLSWVLGDLLIVVGALSALSNLGTPTHSEVVNHLADLEKARLAEALHLRQTLRNQVWPGWGEVKIPAIVYIPESGNPIPRPGSLPNDYQEVLYWTLTKNTSRLLALQLLALLAFVIFGIIFFGLAINLGKMPSQEEFSLRYTPTAYVVDEQEGIRLFCRKKPIQIHEL